VKFDLKTKNPGGPDLDFTISNLIAPKLHPDQPNQPYWQLLNRNEPIYYFTK